MKIELSEEMAEFVKELSKEMLSQDRRGTADPYYYTIFDKRITAVPDGCGDEVRFEWDGDLMTEEEIKKQIECDKPGSNFECELDRLIGEGQVTPFEVVEESHRPENSNVFLTEKACHRHIEQNKHRFNKPSSFVDHAWRNPEMEKLYQLIHEIAKKLG